MQARTEICSKGTIAQTLLGRVDMNRVLKQHDQGANVAVREVKIKCIDKNIRILEYYDTMTR